ncbi:MAG TPA: folylpolyglutamate synthase/dihydrofolate synthase family protein [Aggregatilineaceae bacterium]|nr:folylpolyglutamate synthase/dihydrofolate synthase family protein [Aggregatilineaceae bacterium]
MFAYADALNYLYGFINWEAQRHMRYDSDAMAFERPLKVLAALEHPQTRYPVIHLTGTKGKGSVAAMCASICQAAGLRTGLFSSPHLQDFRERFRVNNELIGEEQLAELISRMKPVLDSVEDLTWFEAITALAFQYFADEQVDVAVIEVGLGGRLDATNVVNPLVTVISSISYDHMTLLGNSLASIAREKAGIIKPGVPVVSAPQAPEALEVLMEVAAEREAPLTLVGHDWLYTAGHWTWSRQYFTAGRAEEVPQAYYTALVGEHQALNATVALAALDVAAARAGWAIDEASVQTGLQHVDWPGRLEVVERTPLLILDVAHNGASAFRLCEALTDIFPRRPLALIFGVYADKDVAAILDALLPITDYLITTQAVNPRAMASDQIAQVARDLGFMKPIEVVPQTDEALRRAEELVGSGGLICATGSLSVVGEIRTLCRLPVGHVIGSGFRD